MFRILCITSGDYIKINKSIANAQLSLKGINPELKSSMASLVDMAYNYNGKSWDYLEFSTEEAAKWFISHRLMYNSRRKNTSKLYVMKSLFDYNNIPGWETSKLDFEIDTV